MTSINSTPAEGNFCDEHGKAQKLATVSVWTNLTTWQILPYQQTDLGMDKKAIFSLLNLTILTSCGSKSSHQQLRLTLVRELIQELGKVPQNQTTRRGRQALSTSQLNSLDTRYNKQWPTQWKRIRCNVCSTENKERQNELKYPECNEVFCVSPCFKLLSHQTAFLKTN